MFTEVDYEQYFAATKETDEKMLVLLDEIISRVTDPEMRKKLNGIREDETSHLELDDELLDILHSQSVYADV